MIVCSDNLCPMNNLDFLRVLGQNKDYLYHQDSGLSECVKNTDLFISDDKCTHRIIGLQKKGNNLQISIICAHYEIIRIKQIIFQKNKKIICDSQLSAKLFKYPKGSNIYPSDLEPTNVKTILRFFYPELRIKLNKNKFQLSNRTFSSFLILENMISILGKPDSYNEYSASWNYLWNIRLSIYYLQNKNNYITNIYLEPGYLNLEIINDCFINEDLQKLKSVKKWCRKKKEIFIGKPKIKVSLSFNSIGHNICISFQYAETRISKAVKEKNLKVIKQLLNDNKSDLNILCCGGLCETPLMYSIFYDLPLKIIIYLMKYSDLSVTDIFGKNIWRYIKELAKYNKIRFLILTVLYQLYKTKIKSIQP